MSTKSSLLLLIDMQARLAPAIAESQALVVRAALLLESASLLRVPALCSEHCPQRIGHTLPSLRAGLPATAVGQKTAFSVLREPGWAERIAAANRQQIVVVGMEAHVCVLQSVLDLLRAGYEVFVVTDACGSRTLENKQVGFARMAAAGAGLVTSEMVLFEWLERADHPDFKMLIEKIK